LSRGNSIRQLKSSDTKGNAQMNYYIQERLAEYHRHDLASVATTHRVFAEAFGQAGQPTTLDHALAQFGRWLVERGKRLEERHGQRSPSPARKAPAPQSPAALSHNHEMTFSRGIQGL
jgi:hypothetical protein